MEARNEFLARIIGHARNRTIAHDAAKEEKEIAQDIVADAVNVAILQDMVHVHAIGANHNLKWVLDR